LALLLAALGVYSTTAFQVEQRRRDTGIRMALGASPGRTLAEVLRQGLALVLPGIVLGAILAMPASRLMTSLLYEVGPLDAPTHLAVLGCLLISALLACLVPALRAARVDPSIALRSE